MKKLVPNYNSYEFRGKKDVNFHFSENIVQFCLLIPGIICSLDTYNNLDTPVLGKPGEWYLWLLSPAGRDDGKKCMRMRDQGWKWWRQSGLCNCRERMCKDIIYEQLSATWRKGTILFHYEHYRYLLSMPLSIRWFWMGSGCLLLSFFVHECWLDIFSLSFHSVAFINRLINWTDIRCTSTWVFTLICLNESTKRERGRERGRERNCG